MQKRYPIVIAASIILAGLFLVGLYVYVSPVALLFGIISIGFLGFVILVMTGKE